MNYFTKLKLNLIKYFYTFLSISVGVLLYIIFVLPFAIITLLPLFIIRVGSHLVAKIVRPDLIPIWNAIDDAFTSSGVDKEERATIVIGKIEIEGEINIFQFKKHFHNTFLSTPQLCKKYENLFCIFEEWGFYIYKKKVELNLSKNIQIYEGAELCSEHEIVKFLETWGPKCNSDDTPNWTLLLIPLKSAEKTILAFKADHGLLDGFTMMEILTKLCGQELAMEPQGPTRSLLTKIVLILEFPITFVKTIVNITRVGKIPTPVPNTSTEPLLKNCNSGSDKLFCFAELDQAKIKRIKKETNCHYSSILGTIYFGALRRHFENITKDPSTKIPKAVHLVMPEGLSNHPATKIDGRMGNHFTFTVIKFPFTSEDPLKRLMKAEESLKEAERGFGFLFNWFILRLLMWPIPKAGSLFLINFLQDQCSKPYQVAMSGFMASSFPHYLLGKKCSKIACCSTVPSKNKNIEIGFFPLFHSGRVDIMIWGTKGMFKDYNNLELFSNVYLKDELELLNNSVFKQDSKYEIS